MAGECRASRPRPRPVGCSVVADAATRSASAALLAGARWRYGSSRDATILRPLGPSGAVGAWLLLLLFGGGCSRAEAVAQRGLHFEPRVLEIGDVDEGDEPVVRFAFSNRGIVALELRDVIPSCSCSRIAVEFGGREYVVGDSERLHLRVAPGQSGHVVARVTTRGVAGRKTGSLTCYHDGGLERVAWSMDVARAWRVEPSAIVVQDVSRGEARAFRVDLAAERGPWRVVGPVTAPPGCAAELSDSETSSDTVRGWRVVGTIDTGAEGFDPTAKLRVATDHPRVPEIEIPIRVRFAADLRITPGSFLTVSPRDLRDGTELRVSMEAIDESELAIEAIEFLDGNRSSELVSWRHERLGAGAMLTAAIAGSEMTGLLRMRYRVRVRHRQVEDVVLTVLGHARPAAGR